MERLTGSVQPYAWGSRLAIAMMQRRPPPGGPEAELWFGAHPVAPSRLDDGRTLGELVAAEPERALGPSVQQRFGGFPFLLKVLAADQPLSVQVHPDARRAAAGFAREERAGIPRDDPERTYRDPNHKPELICALSRFEAKCGFRPVTETVDLLERLRAAAPGPGLIELAAILTSGSDDERALQRALGWLLDRSRPDLVTAAIDEAVTAARQLAGSAAPVGGERSVPDRTGELVWTAELATIHPGDPGILVALLLNHVVLEPGQALFLGAGNLHSYLRGVGVELMANSDNVIRGGLTVKHVDVDELLQVVDTVPAAAPVQEATGRPHRYRSPVPEFALTGLGPGADERFEPIGPEIVLVTGGAATLSAEGGGPAVTIESGDAAFVAGSEGPYRVTTDDQGVAWRATVGDPTPG